ncbi:MAG: DNA polymerase III subunit tau [Elusimicrobia bacterium ADurb.Bin231]|nr:MAG: DNA polymerase III subunit tau [Elusimicrobia bacterium ADurb.Bin231]
MSYLILARKYRPQKFEDIVGQEHITRVLKNAIKENRTAHGYIFSGQRGIGKTTTARIFAKALNCTNKKEDEPCDKCRNCEEIIKTNSMDVLEIDGASNRGIDEIRNLRENIKYAPACSKYKIYIIDEAHQITEQAFNALLKTLEEPPSHSIFIMATTEPQKIPDTIASRCQRFGFKPVSIKEISNHLLSIAKKENIDIDDVSINTIARAAGGSLRDSLSIFDQIISFCGTKIRQEEIISALGMLKEDVLSEMAEYIYGNDAKSLLSAIRKTTASGYDPMNIANDLQGYIRNILLNKIASGTVAGISDTKKLTNFSDNISTDVLVRHIELLSECVYRMKNAEQPIMFLEVTAIKLTRRYIGLDEIVRRLENIEGNGNSKEHTEMKIKDTSASYIKPVSRDNITKKNTDSSSDKISKESIQPVRQDAESDKNSEKINQIWRKICSEFSDKPLLSTYLSESSVSMPEKGKLEIVFAKKFKLDLVETNRNIWLPVIQSKLGKSVSCVCVLKNDIPSTSTAKTDSPAEEYIESESEEEEIISAPEEISSQKDNKSDKKSQKSNTASGNTSGREDEPVVNQILDIFGGTIVETND